MLRTLRSISRHWSVLLVIIIISMVIGVSSAQEITVTIYGTFGSASEAFTNEFPQLVQSIYPEISVEIEIPRLIPITAPDREWPQMIENGEYDIFVLPRLGIYDPEVNFLSLDRYVASIEEHNPTLNTHVEASKINGLTYVIPQVITSYGVVYNRDIFVEASVEVPDYSWTWIDFRETAQRLAHQTEVAVLIDGSVVEIFLLQQGISLVDVTESELEAALHFFEEMADAGWIVPGYGEYSSLFQDGEAAMRTGTILTLAVLLSETHIEHGFVGTPSHGASTLANLTQPTSIAGISARTKHPDAAWKVLELMSMSEGAHIRGRSGVLPTYVNETILRDWSNTVFSSPNMAGEIRELMGLPMVMLDWGNSRSTDDLSIALTLASVQVMSGNQTVQSAVEEFMQLRATQGH